MNGKDCQRFTNSPIYRRLCQALSLKPANNEYTGFTGQRDTDLELLSHFTDKELIDVCATNKYINGLCQSEGFWITKTLNKFGDSLGDANTIMEKYIPAGTSWKEYYIWLSGMAESDPAIVFQLAVSSGREDLIAILDPEFLTNLPPGVIPLAGGWGHRIPRYISADMQNFFKEADLGPSDPSDPYSVPLNTVIDFNILTPAEVGSLFHIYADVNNLWDFEDRWNRGIRTTPLMRKYFAEDFPRIISGGDLDLHWRPGVDYSDMLTMKSVHALARFHYIPNAHLSQEQRDTLADADLYRYLQSTLVYLKRVLKFYDEKRILSRRKLKFL